LALEMVDGGWLEGVAISNIQMQRVRTPIFIRRGNRRPRPDGAPGYLRGILIDNIHATGAILTNSITGLPGFDVEDVTLSNIRIDSEEAGKADWVSRKIPEVERSYPEARMFGRLPAYGFYCRHVKGLRLRQLELTCTPAEERPAVVCDDVKDFELEGFRSGRKTGSMPVIELAQTQEAFLHGCVAPAGTGTFLHVTGEKSRQIVVLNNNLAQSQKQADDSPEVDPSALTVAGNVGNA